MPRLACRTCVEMDILSNKRLLSGGKNPNEYLPRVVFILDVRCGGDIHGTPAAYRLTPKLGILPVVSVKVT